MQPVKHSILPKKSTKDVHVGKEDKIYFLYVTGILDNPILKSQVLNWIEVLQEQGIVFNILSCPSLPYLIKHGKRQKAIVKEFRDKLKGRIYQVATLRSLDQFDFISSIIKAVYIQFLLFRKGGKESFSSVILQTRSGFNYRTFKLLKKINKKIKLVFDFRGAAPEEYLNSLSIDNIEEVRNRDIRKKYQRLLDRDAKIAEIGDLIYCVSDSLKKYIIRISGERITTDKIYVVPGAADENNFYYNPTLRTNKRKELRLENMRILIYTGRLKNNYHKKELVFEFAAKFIAMDPANYFICLTPDAGMAGELKVKNGIAGEKILVGFVNDPREINAYLNAADLGIILRDNIPTNRVASPTKLAEYLLAGLPVMASDHIGDYSDFIRDNELGFVVDNRIDEMLMLAARCDFSLTARLRNSVIAKARFSKQANIEMIKAALASLAKNGSNKVPVRK